MSAPTLYTEREKVLAVREAAARARCFTLISALLPDTHASRGDVPCAACTAVAKFNHPLPKTTRPRVVNARSVEGHMSPFVQWRALDGVLEYQCHGVWLWDKEMTERVTLLADLLANPTEEVDDDE